MNAKELFNITQAQLIYRAAFKYKMTRTGQKTNFPTKVNKPDLKRKFESRIKIIYI